MDYIWSAFKALNAVEDGVLFLLPDALRKIGKSVGFVKCNLSSARVVGETPTAERQNLEIAADGGTKLAFMVPISSS